METTFITIHNLSPEANIMFASESIVDVLGFQPQDVINRSCFDYFHPDEVPVAKWQHTRGVHLDRAAVLHYARIRDRNNQWISCECVFTVVYDVLVACTSIYRVGMEKSQRATFDAPYVRRLFSSSPRDPRYHMLQHLSPKFQNAPDMDREPRAALILNRFTQNLAVIHATPSIAEILGATPDQVKNKSFYELIDEGCLGAAMRCLESAKANDSIAYLRFWSRDPVDLRHPEDVDGHSSNDASDGPDSEDGGVVLPSEEGSVARQSNEPAPSSSPDGPHGGPLSSHGVRLDASASGESSQMNRSGSQISGNGGYNSSRHSSGRSTDLEHDAAEAVFEMAGSRSSTSSLAVAPAPMQQNQLHPMELEAVVSCTSDGLVVILRRARAIIPATVQTLVEMQQGHGTFAAPWGAYQDVQPQRANFNAAGLPNYAVPHHVAGHGIVSTGPSIDNVMNAIRDVAVFAWSLVGINGNIATHGHGTPAGEAMPPDGLPVWDPRAAVGNHGLPPNNQAQEMWDPWSGRVHQQEPVEQNPLFHGKDPRDEYRFDDLAPSATVARARMWQAREGSASGQIRDGQAHPGRWDGFGDQPPVVARPAVPSMQQFNADADADADADAGGRGRGAGNEGSGAGSHGDHSMKM